MTEQLKPCPLCGGKRLRIDFWEQPNHYYWYISCLCGAQLQMSTREAVIEKWNTRPEEDRLRAIVDAQREVIEAMRDQITDKLDVHCWTTPAIETACAKLEELEAQQ